MHIFHRRPVAFAACLYVLCAAVALKLSSALHLALLIAAGCVLVGLALLFLLKKRVGKRGILALLCLVAVVLSLGTSFGFFKIRYADLQSLVGKPCAVEGLVTERLSGDVYFSRFRITVDRLNGEENSFDALLECDYSSSLQPGDRFLMNAVVRAFRTDEYFDEEEYTLSDGCMLVLVSDTSESCTHLGNNTASLSVSASSANQKLSYKLNEATGRNGLSSRLLLGNGTFLSEIDRLHFTYTGVSHLLALSGLHVSILIGFLELILKRIRVPRVGRAILIPIASIGYLILTGSPISAVRAVLMVCVLYLAYLWREEYDSFTALTLVLVLILQFSPYAIYDLSLWLSFCAAGSIIIFMPLIQGMMNKWKEKTSLPRPVFTLIKGVLSALAVGMIVNIAMLPLSAAIFGEVSLWSVPVTLLFSVPVSLILILGFLTLVFPFLPFLGELCGAVEAWMLSTAQSFFEIENGLLPLVNDGCRMLLWLLTAALVLFAVLKIKRLIWWLTVPILCAAVLVSSYLSVYIPSQENTQESVLEYARGNICIYTKEGRAVVVNHTSGALNPAYEIKTVVNQACCTEIKSLVFDSYYQQSTYLLCKLSERICVRTLHLPLPQNEREAAISKRICIDAERYGIRVLFDAEEQLEKYPCKEK